jgi:hypothetical protein
MYCAHAVAANVTIHPVQFHSETDVSAHDNRAPLGGVCDISEVRTSSTVQQSQNHPLLFVQLQLAL